MASYFTDDRAQVLVSSFLFAVGLVLFLWFAGAVANTLREKGEGRVAATAIAAGTAWVVIQLVLTAITAALAHSIAADGDARACAATEADGHGTGCGARLPACSHHRGRVLRLPARTDGRRAERDRTAPDSCLQVRLMTAPHVEISTWRDSDPPKAEHNASLMTRLLPVAVVLSVAAVGLIPSSVRAARDVSPDTFSQVSSGVALIHTSRCNGRPIGQGTGFLVGASVVMTARHVLLGACRVRVRVAGGNFVGTRWVEWSGGGTSSSAADLETIKLDRPANDGFVFRVRSSPVRVGLNLGMVGYPLGNRLSLNQGKIIERGKVNGAPLLAVRMLGAEGASGSPFIDDQGRVVGILQLGLGSEDVLGQRTAGVLVGLDLVRWWGPRARLDLCRAYPNGGIAGCLGAKPPPTPPPPACSNGRDDDGDGRLDYPADPGCSSPSDTNETDTTPPPVAVTPGSYKGQTQAGNFVFFTVSTNRTVNGWRVNDIRRTCNGGFYIYGAIDLGSNSALPIDAAGRFSSQVNYDTTINWDTGDVTPAKAVFKISGLVQGSSASGTVLSTFDFDRNGSHYTCSNGNETWTANLLP